MKAKQTTNKKQKQTNKRTTTKNSNQQTKKPTNLEDNYVMINSKYTVIWNQYENALSGIMDNLHFVYSVQNRQGAGLQL